MSTFFKLGLVAGVVGLLVWGSKAAQTALSNFKFDVAGYGKPTFKGMVVTVPLQITFSNPTPVPIHIDRLIADVYIDKNGTWTLAAKVNEPVNIVPGNSSQWIFPSADLASIFGGSLLNTLTTAQQIYTNKKMRIRSDVTLIVKGVALPQQSITNDISL